MREQRRELGHARQRGGRLVGGLRDVDAPRARLASKQVDALAGNVAGRAGKRLAHERALPRRGIGKHELTRCARQLAKADEHAGRQRRALLGHEIGQSGSGLRGIHETALPPDETTTLE